MGEGMITSCLMVELSMILAGMTLSVGERNGAELPTARGVKGRLVLPTFMC